MKIEEESQTGTPSDSDTIWKKRQGYRVARLKHLIGFSNNYCPYSARDMVIAKALDFRSCRSVQRVLRPLAKDGDVVRRTTPPRRAPDGASFTKARKLFMRSPFSEYEGALAVALLADVEPKVFDSERVASLLWSTPEQAWGWAKSGRHLGFIDLRLLDWKHHVFARGPKYPGDQVACVAAPPLPDLARPAMNAAEVLERVLDVVREAEARAGESGVLEPITNERLAAATGTSVSWIEKLVRREVRGQRLHRTVLNGSRYLATRADWLPSPSASSTNPDWIPNVLDLLHEGPVATDDLRRALAPEKLPRSFEAMLGMHGVVVTRFGNERIVSRGPLVDAHQDPRESGRLADGVRIGRKLRGRGHEGTGSRPCT